MIVPPIPIGAIPPPNIPPPCPRRSSTFLLGPPGVQRICLRCESQPRDGKHRTGRRRPEPVPLISEAGGGSYRELICFASWPETVGLFFSRCIVRQTPPPAPAKCLS